MFVNGDDLGEMLMGVKGACPKCSTIMSFEASATFAKKNGINDNVVMCEKCGSVFTIELTPRNMTFTADVTQKYVHLQKAVTKKPAVSSTQAGAAKPVSRKTTEKKWWQFWK